VPNAYTAGYNTILFNAGLFTRIKNEAQFAFVLAHELAHLVLKHNDKSIDKYLSTIKSKEFKAEVAAIKKQQFGQGKALEELTKTFSFDTRKHSRFSEKDADEQAILWMQKSGYSVEQTVDCLALLDTVDNDICDVKQVFQKYLNFEEQPYKPSYFGATRRSVFGAAAFADDNETTFIKDSLSTHPDCKQRVLYATGLINGSAQKNGSNFLVDESFFYTLQHKLKNEIIDFTIKSEKVSRGLFYALEQLSAGNESPLVIMKISEAFDKLYTAQKNHTLGKITDLPDPQRFSASYNALLYYIQNASLSDFASVNYYFTSYYVKQYSNCKQMANCMANCAANMERQDEAAH
jgi:hypothetical protein